jgi:hypothetical protein
MVSLDGQWMLPNNLHIHAAEKPNITHLVTHSLSLINATIARTHFNRAIGPCPAVRARALPTATSMVTGTIFWAAQNFITGIETF